MLKTKKQMLVELKVLDPKIIEELPSVRDDPELVAASQKLLEFESRLKAIKLQQTKGFPDVSGPAPRFDKAADAAVIMAGGKLDQLPDVENRGRRLIREFEALSVVIAQQTELVGQINCRAIKRLCEEHRDMLFPFWENLITAFEQLDRALRQLSSVTSTLASKSYTGPFRPPGWDILPFEQVLLFGGHGISSLAWWIAQRRKALGLTDGDGTGKTKKGV